MTTTFKSISVPQVRFDSFTGEIAYGQRPIVRPRDRIATSEIKSFLKASGSNSGERWITINSDNEGGGTHVKINGDGKIVAGPAGLAARGITHLSDFGKGKEGGDKAKQADRLSREAFDKTSAAHMEHGVIGGMTESQKERVKNLHVDAMSAHEKAAEAHRDIGSTDVASMHMRKAERHKNEAKTLVSQQQPSAIEDAKRDDRTESSAPVSGEVQLPNGESPAKVPEQPESPPESTEPSDKTDPRADQSIPAMDSEKPSETPRQAAERQQKAIDEAYAFARKSAVGNAGEDLKGSARHKRNEWRGLEAAEENGTAKAMVTRDNLLKAEPHNLMEKADKNPLTALAMHYALRQFPAKPGYGKKEATAKDRQEYHEAYQKLKGVAEDLADRGVDAKDAMRTFQSQVSQLISSLRSRKITNSIGNEVTDSYNPTANGLCSVSMFGGKNSAFGRLSAFADEVKVKYGGIPTEDESKRSYFESVADHAKDVMEGKSVNDSFGKSPDGKNVSRWTPSDRYVNVATRKGGRDVSSLTVDPNQATENLLNKFGSRGVQWGNSVTDDERVHHARKLVESLSDLADVTGIKPDDLALGGRLGWAIGARGHGTASAHYEPSTQVINLTRKSGVGALAHEWGHAFDHSIKDFHTSADDADYASENVSSTRIPRDEKGAYITDDKNRLVTVDMSKDPMWSGFNELRKAFRESGFDKRISMQISKERENGMSDSKAKYWRSTREKFARSFERYVQHKLGLEGRENTYLSGLADPSETSLWPTNDEISHMAPAFENLLSAYRQQKYGSPEPAKFDLKSLAAVMKQFSGGKDF